MRPEDRNITLNRRARHEYFIEETYEAGLVLTGTEVKSLRAGKANLTDAYARVINGEVWLYQCNISPFERGNRFNHDPVRPRKLLLHKVEIRQLQAESQEKGLTIVPLRMYWVKGRAKVEIGVAKAKKLWDKRDDVKKREMDREAAQAMKR
jgi:SsrA-binding protein